MATADKGEEPAGSPCGVLECRAVGEQGDWAGPWVRTPLSCCLGRWRVQLSPHGPQTQNLSLRSLA